MNRLKIKMMLIITFLMIICIAPAKVFATNDDIQIYKNNNNEYLIYVKDLVNQEFKFAVSNSELEPLGYINSGKDKQENANSIAYLSEEQANEENLYIWIKKDNQYILKGERLELNQSITEEQVKLIDNQTKKIKVDTTQKTETTEVVDGVTKTKTRGKIVITDDQNAEYEYERNKVGDYAIGDKLNEIAEKIKNNFSEMDMYEKLEVTQEYNNLYKQLLENAIFEKVENMTIEQPEESVTGDKYVVLIKKTVDGETDYDIQYMTCYNEYDEAEITEQVVVKQTSKLPITYDNGILLVIFALVIIAIIVVSVRMIRLKKSKGND